MTWWRAGHKPSEGGSEPSPSHNATQHEGKHSRPLFSLAEASAFRRVGKVTKTELFQIKCDFLKKILT